MQSIAALIRAGVDPDLIAQVVSDMLAAQRGATKQAKTPAERQAEKRARDKKSDVTQSVTVSSEESRDVVTVNPSPSLPNDNNSNPTYPHQSSSVPSEDSEPSEPKTKTKSVAAEIRDMLGEILSPQLVKDVVLHRKAVKAAPTVKATELLIKALVACGDPERGAEMMISRGWRGFEVDWYRKAQSARGSPGNKGFADMANLGNQGTYQNGNGPHTINDIGYDADDADSGRQKHIDLLPF